MNPTSDAFLERLLVTFRSEAEEHLHIMSTGLIEFEKTEGAGERTGIIERVFREAHSLKGASRAVNLTQIEALCHSIEGVLLVAKRGELSLTPTALDVLHRAIDRLRGLIGAESWKEPVRADLGFDRLSGELDGILHARQRTDEMPLQTRDTVRHHGEARKGAVRVDSPIAGGAESVRVPTKRLESLLIEVEDMLSVRMAATQLAEDLQQSMAEFADWRREWGKVRHRVRIEERRRGRIDGALNEFRPRTDSKSDAVGSFLGFLTWNETFISTFENKIGVLARLASRNQRQLQSAVDTLLRETKRTLMLPLSYLTDPLEVVVRELSREQGKEVEFRLEGTDIEVDGLVLQAIRDPIIHLLRNCIDHGMELPEVRQKNGKTTRGIVTLSISQSVRNEVEIRIADDGTGIDIVKLKEAAFKQELISAETKKNLDDREALRLVFISGLSTSVQPTDISGRGLGLAIVQEKVENLGGAVNVATVWGSGTAFTLTVPVTLSTSRGVLVRVSERIFVLPTSYVERVIRLEPENIHTVENRATVSIDNRTVSLAKLREVIEVTDGPMRENAPNNVSAVVVASTGHRIAFEVDEVVGEQEILVKSLGTQLPRVRNVSGAAVLGTGKVVPVLYVPDLMKSAIAVAVAESSFSEATPINDSRGKQILIVEDSITSRSLMKNILEGAGYIVATAVDGVDGFRIAREKSFDLVVSDVDMPRMNGFDLTSRIRADKKLAELPVVLVTALESVRDRERGMEVGANAYIVKSSFEQSDLLETIERLV